MHELSIAHEIIGIVRENLPAGNSHSVKTVKLKIGKLTNILPDSLTFCFDALVKDTSLDGARLDIQHIPITLQCTVCNAVSEIEGFAFACPSCGGTDIRTIAGDELRVSEIELND